MVVPTLTPVEIQVPNILERQGQAPATGIWHLPRVTTSGSLLVARLANKLQIVKVVYVE